MATHRNQVALVTGGARRPALATFTGWGKEITMPTHADDELEIMRLLARLAQAVDDRDADAYRDCLADEVVCLVSDTSPNEVWRAVSREAYARRAVETVPAVHLTPHPLSNFLILLTPPPPPRNVHLPS